jgi:hypothetical protein
MALSTPSLGERFEVIRFYKELHSSAFCYWQLPGRIVFHYKQLSSTTQAGAKVRSGLL